MISREMMKAAHQTLAEYRYELRPVVHGYANRTLYVNLSQQEIVEKPVTQQMKELFTGGRGFGLWLLWNAIDGRIGKERHSGYRGFRAY
jgi:aldehyde:ferredoxin oxidoreductase